MNKVDIHPSNMVPLMRGKIPSAEKFKKDKISFFEMLKFFNSYFASRVSKDKIFKTIRSGIDKNKASSLQKIESKKKKKIVFHFFKFKVR